MKCNIKFVVGLDLGNKKHDICELNWKGEKTLAGKVENDSESLNVFFDRYDNPCEVRVAMESGSSSAWISEILKVRGFQVYVGNARKMRAIWDTDCKTDERDAEMIARLARFDLKLLCPITHRSAEAQMDLAVIKARDGIVRNRTALINEARGLSKTAGISLPSCSAESFARKVKEFIPEGLQPALLPLLMMIDAQTKLLRHYDNIIEELCEKYKETDILREIAGVGVLTSLGFILTLENPLRFAKSRDVGPYLGLVPKQDKSGNIDKTLGITKAGNSHQRRLLVGAAQYILGPFGPPCDLRRFGERIAGDGKNKIRKRKAVIAVARKLAVLLHHLWKTGDKYDPDHKANNKRLKLKKAS
jgi:transposase